MSHTPGGPDGWPNRRAWCPPRASSRCQGEVVARAWVVRSFSRRLPSPSSWPRSRSIRGRPKWSKGLSWPWSWRCGWSERCLELCLSSPRPAATRARREAALPAYSRGHASPGLYSALSPCAHYGVAAVAGVGRVFRLGDVVFSGGGMERVGVDCRTSAECMVPVREVDADGCCLAPPLS